MWDRFILIKLVMQRKITLIKYHTNPKSYGHHQHKVEHQYHYVYRLQCGLASRQWGCHAGPKRLLHLVKGQGNIKVCELLSRNLNKLLSWT